MTLPTTERKHRAVALAWFLGGALTAGILLAMSPPTPAALPSAAGQAELFYTRIQTITIHSPLAVDIYTTTYTTTFQTHITDFRLNDWINLPPNTVVRTTTCQPTWPPTATCQAVIDPTRVIFSGTVGGKATIYLNYDTRSRAWRDPQSPLIRLEYPVGPQEPTWLFSLTNTIIFSRTIGPVWEPLTISPDSYVYSDTACIFAYTTTACSLRWSFTETSRLTFSLTLRETLLGSDLTVENVSMNNYRPAVGELVHYTVTVRNVGAYTTGRPVIAGLYIRPVEQGPPVVLTSTFGGPITFGDTALFKWAGLSPPSYWWHGLVPGEAIVGSTVLTWPTYCVEPGACGVWAYADVLRWQTGYEWYGHSPEGTTCSLSTLPLMPTCDEENNNYRAVDWPIIYLPLVCRTAQ